MGHDRGTDSVQQALETNRGRIEDHGKRKAAEFLVKMADARMMDTHEGQVARDRAVYPDVRAYGEAMVRDQPVLLQEIKALASSKGITLPGEISHAKAEGLEDLAKQTGEDVDDKFISMITIDHKRDVRAFRKAARLEDPEVKAFAERRLPMIEGHLAEIEAIDARH